MPGVTNLESDAGVPDTGMEEAPQDEVMEDDQYQYEEENEDDIQKVKLLPGSTDQAASFEFEDEGHTLGNALRFIIMKNPNVEFCAYAIPHPSETKMNIRIQTYEGTAIAALEKGLKDLQDLCDVVADKYNEARQDFGSTKAVDGGTSQDSDA